MAKKEPYSETAFSIFIFVIFGLPIVGLFLPSSPSRLSDSEELCLEKSSRAVPEAIKNCRELRDPDYVIECFKQLRKIMPLVESCEDR